MSRVRPQEPTPIFAQTFLSGDSCRTHCSKKRLQAFVFISNLGLFFLKTKEKENFFNLISDTFKRFYNVFTKKKNLINHKYHLYSRNFTFTRKSDHSFMFANNNCHQLLQDVTKYFVVFFRAFPFSKYIRTKSIVW